MMKIFRFFALISILFVCSTIMADDNEQPTINPMATFVNDDGDEEETTSISGSAPLTVTLHANATGTDGWTTYYEWRFTDETSTTPYLIRYEEDTEFTFKKSGSTKVVLYATFTRGNDIIAYTEEYWADIDPITITISESNLNMPNAFSPNGDGINDIYKAKEGYQSLVEFHAYIFNRWGQKLFEWTDPAEGWDGTFNGHDVAQGVYYVMVKAVGADGRKYHIRKDVNLLRGYTEEKSYE